MRLCSFSPSCVASSVILELTSQILERCTVDGAGNSAGAVRRLGAFCLARVRCLPARYDAMQPEHALVVALFDLYHAVAALSQAQPELCQSFATSRVCPHP